MSTPTGDMLTLQQLCELLRINRRTASKGIAAGLLPGTKVGRKYIIPRAAVDRFMQGEKSPPPEPKPEPDGSAFIVHRNWKRVGLLPKE